MNGGRNGLYCASMSLSVGNASESSLAVLKCKELLTYAWMSNSFNIAWYSDSVLRAAWFGKSVTFSIVGGFLTTRYASSPTFKIAPCCQARSLEMAPSTTLQIRSLTILHLWKSCHCHLPRLHWALGQMGDALSRIVWLSRLEWWHIAFSVKHIASDAKPHDLYGAM